MTNKEETSLEFNAWLKKYHHITVSSFKHGYSEKEKKEFKIEYEKYLNSRIQKRFTQVTGPQCGACKGYHSVYVREEDLKKYRAGEGLIQQCFPYLSASEREILLSGMNDECWTKVFGRDEE